MLPGCPARPRTRRAGALVRNRVHVDVPSHRFGSGRGRGAASAGQVLQAPCQPPSAGRTCRRPLRRPCNQAPSCSPSASMLSIDTSSAALEARRTRPPQTLWFRLRSVSAVTIGNQLAVHALLISQTLLGRRGGAVKQHRKLATWRRRWRRSLRLARLTQARERRSTKHYKGSKQTHSKTRCELSPQEVRLSHAAPAEERRRPPAAAG